ncbi:MAG: hypothetical protein LBQ74_12940 [Prevotella sp.]|jgi:hypothetical protein|nr:hypothetical protein [Prevotella sp.]
MKFIQKLKTWNHNRRDPKKVFPKSEHIIKHAFTVAGVDYYQFDDIYNLPYERGLMALAVYEETRMNCSKEYLEKHVEVMRDLLHSKNIDIYKINQLNEQIAERLKISFDTPLLYKLASIVFFDKNENPALYEYDYCNRKIAFWKEHKGVADFFLQKPLQELIPFLNTLDFDFQKYSEVIEELDKVHSARLQALESKS